MTLLIMCISEYPKICVSHGVMLIKCDVPNTKWPKNSIGILAWNFNACATFNMSMLPLNFSILLRCTYCTYTRREFSMKIISLPQKLVTIITQYYLHILVKLSRGKNKYTSIIVLLNWVLSIRNSWIIVHNI